MTVSGGGSSTRYGFKVFDHTANRWYLFTCHNVVDYDRWLRAFDDERRCVTEDRLSGFDVSAYRNKALLSHRLLRDNYIGKLTTQQEISLFGLQAFVSLIIIHFTLNQYCKHYCPLVFMHHLSPDYKQSTAFGLYVQTVATILFIAVSPRCFPQKNCIVHAL